MTLLVTFHSVSSALYAQKLLAKQAVSCAVVPVPRSVSSSCGYALEASGLPASLLAETMSAAGVEWEALYNASFPEKKKEQYVLVNTNS
jgi:hypothetical protein